MGAIRAVARQVARLPDRYLPVAVDFGLKMLGVLLAVRPHCHTDHYWQVWFDTNRAIVETGKALALPPPFNVERDEIFPRAA